MKPRRIFSLIAGLGLGCLLAGAQEPPARGELFGQVELRGSDGKSAAAVGTVVWLPGVPASAAPAGPSPTLTSRKKRFEPHVLAVERGTTVTFPNVDKIFHNVFSRTAGSEFDLGLYRNGDTRTMKFSKPGLATIFCNIHPQMAAYVMVLDGTAFVMTDENGFYRLADLPPGEWVVHLWNEKGGEKQAPVEIVGGRRTSLDQTFDASGYRLLPHKNKHGEDYPPATRDDDRY